MRIVDYLRLMDEIHASNLVCASCGAVVYTTLINANESFCNFCESYVTKESLNSVNANSDIERTMQGMQNAAKDYKWEKGVPFADALAATKNPMLLYGASTYYKAFSDFVYSDVDYTQGGFMYSNADNRSDEQLKNKYNAMALISKSKEYLFKTLKITSANASPGPQTLYLRVMSNIKLKRYRNAATEMIELNSAKEGATLSKYARMVFDMETTDHAKNAIKPPDVDDALGSANLFYYYAKYLAKKKDFGSAIYVLSNLTEKVLMPMASYYTDYLRNISAASGLSHAAR
ncbi:MAG: hypothetical protein KGH64_03425 [Candidatus Micrarchaeota archaeon]|nr:hypothetical protein [Candidatus Micrarchaeota archaeon]MDE1834363.1 hypothetical protein [Candidatus Micrarchaeota archaeon]MDE1859235.1 hypothetical protein [Candidatus Micrarchaeota archaeon]